MGKTNALGKVWHSPGKTKERTKPNERAVGVKSGRRAVYWTDGGSDRREVEPEA